MFFNVHFISDFHEFLTGIEMLFNVHFSHFPHAFSIKQLNIPFYCSISNCIENYKEIKIHHKHVAFAAWIRSEDNLTKFPCFFKRILPTSKLNSMISFRFLSFGIWNFHDSKWKSCHLCCLKWIRLSRYLKENSYQNT